MVGTLVAELLLDITLGVNGVAADCAMEVTARDEVSELAANEGTSDEEDTVTVVEVWTLAAVEDVSVLLRNRAAL